MARGQDGFADAAHVAFVLHAVADQFRYGDHLQPVLLAEFGELRHAGHAPVGLEDFADDRGLAQPQPEWAACAAIPEDVARLACYDRLTGRAAAPVGAVAAPPAAAASAAPPPVPTAVTETSRLARRWDLDGVRAAEPFAPRPYKPVYLLPATWTDRVNQQPSSPAPDHTVPVDLGLRNIEAKYQISLKALFGERLLGSTASLWGGYTQSSRWQVYNGAESRPFRETNYEPELMLVWPLFGFVRGKLRSTGQDA